MKLTTREWVAKAEGDFGMMDREARRRKNVCYDGIGFHAQQCAEKYLKARLGEADVDFPRTHDLTTLLELALPLEPLWEVHLAGLAFLTAFAVIYRYPGESADRSTAIQARSICRAFRKAARAALALKP